MLDCTRASVWARLPSAAGQRGCRMLPGRTSTSSIASWAPSFSRTVGWPDSR